MQSRVYGAAWPCVYQCSSVIQDVKTNMMLKGTSELGRELLSCQGFLGPRKPMNPSPLLSRIAIESADWHKSFRGNLEMDVKDLKKCSCSKHGKNSSVNPWMNG